MFDNYIEENRNNIIKSVMNLINIPSVSEETNSNASAPFGDNCNTVLNEFLNLASNLGFKTKNIENYCGYVEFGEGTELVGIVGHLDVVPADIKDGWTTPPFEATIRDNKIYGRGSIDDKGPVIAALYAMKAINEISTIKKRVRLIVGLNEEKSWKCIDYYKEHEEWPSVGFSPDANFPGIYAEKGILSLKISKEFQSDKFDILDISTNNNAINVVPKFIKIKINLKDPTIILPTSQKDLKITHLENNIYELEFLGTASHAAHPELGDNAIKKFVEYFSTTFSNEYFAFLLNMDLFNIITPKFINEEINDESGILTSNIANCSYKNSQLSFDINFRVPVTYSLDFIIEKYNTLKTIYSDLTIDVIGRQEPLYIEKNTHLVNTLLEVFNKKTNSNAQPIAIGGGTYARAFNNMISYGLTFPGDVDLCHQVDEYVDIDKLVLGAKIYAEAIYQLAK